MTGSSLKIRVRGTAREDFDQIIQITEEVYAFSPPWTRAQLESHLAVFPEGQWVAVDESSGKLLGYSASLIVLWDDYETMDNWKNFTDSGMFKNHDPSRGRTLYGAEVMVHPDAQGKGIGKMLYEARRQLAQSRRLLRIRAGARLPGYHRCSGAMSAEQYVEKVVHKELDDPTLSFQLSQGFHVLEVVSGYLKNDPESLGYAALIEWINPAVAKEEDYKLFENSRFNPIHRLRK